MPRFIRIRLQPGETLDNAYAELANVRAQNFQQTFPRQWQEGVDAEGNVSAKFACWLFCWAAVNEGPTATVSKSWFDRRLYSDSRRVSYDTFDEHVDRDTARSFRNHPDCDQALREILPLGPERPQRRTLEQCDAELRACQADLERTRVALAQSQADLAQRQGELERTKATLAESQTALAQRQTSLEESGTELEKCRSNHRGALGAFADTLRAAYQELKNRLG